MGLKSGNTSSLTAFFKVLNATGWNRKFSCSHEPRVNTLIRVKSLRVRSAHLDERVQVSHSFVIRTLEIDLPPRPGGCMGSSDLIRSVFWISGCLASSRKAKVNVGTGFV